MDIGVLGEPATLDPYDPRASELTYALVRPVFRMPFHREPDGSIEPDLAGNMKIDGHRARLRLVDAVWSDGRKIDARDVVLSVRRASRPSGFADVRTAQAISSRTVELTGNVHNWKATLSTGAFVLPKGRIKRGNIAAGPFRFSSYTRSRKLTYEPNPEAEAQPLLDSLTVSFVQSTELLLRLLERGSVDAAVLPSTVNLGDRLDEAGLSFDARRGSERIVLSFEPERVGRAPATAVMRHINRQLLAGTFLRDNGEMIRAGQGTTEDSSLPTQLSIGAAEGDELLSLLQRAIQLQLEDAGSTVELITAPVATVYGMWDDHAPADALLLRRYSPLRRGTQRDIRLDLPLASVDTFMAWREEVHGIAVDPSLEGPLWNARDWWIEPSI
jgi:hypothetical protein